MFLGIMCPDLTGITNMLQGILLDDVRGAHLEAGVDVLRTNPITKSSIEVLECYGSVGRQ